MAPFASYLFDLRSDRVIDVVGDHFHGWLISRASAVPGLAERLHAPSRGKPFSLGFGRHRHGIWLRVASIDAELSELLARSSPTSVPIGPVELHCVGLWRPGEHAWARKTSGEQLWESVMHLNLVPEVQRLVFVSPTAFASDRRAQTVAPTARLVFKSLIKTWNENASPRIGDDLAFELLESLHEGPSVIRVVPEVRFRSYRSRGFVGWCDYSCASGASDQVRRVLHLLVQFAFFAGVGQRRTMGMGMTLPSDMLAFQNGVPID